MKYVVVDAQSAAELQKKVQALIDQGWEPLGGVSIAYAAVGSMWYAQAVVRPPAE